MGESQLWLELNNTLRKRLPRPLNLCQFLTLPIGEHYQHSVTGGPSRESRDSEAFRGSSKPAAVRQKVLRCWADGMLRRTTEDFYSPRGRTPKGSTNGRINLDSLSLRTDAVPRHRRHRQARCASPLEGTYLSGALCVHSDSAHLGGACKSSRKRQITSAAVFR